MARFTGRVAIVTGGSRGIGRATVELLLREGAAVVATGRDPASLADLAGRHPSAPLAVCQGDTVDRDHQAAAVTLAVERFGRLDHLVNNAGAHDADGPILADDDDRFRRTWEANVLAVRSWVREAAPHWSADSPGAVVNVSSIAGVRGERMLGVYGTTKAAQLHLTEQLALELAPRVRVNAVAPGFTITDGTGEIARVRGDELAALYPLGRVARPADIAGPVTFLLSEDAAMITGQTLVVDGGFTLTLPGGYVPPE